MFRSFQGMDKFDQAMQQRDARLIATIDNSKAAWWDVKGMSPSRGA
jgi:hypothetical protein